MIKVVGAALFLLLSTMAFDAPIHAIDLPRRPVLGAAIAPLPDATRSALTQTPNQAASFQRLHTKAMLNSIRV